MQEASKPKPRLQFGIPTLLLLVVFASIPTAWIANDVKKSHDRDAVEHEWNRRGANVNFAPDRRIAWLGYRPDIAPEIGDDDLLLLEEAPHVEYLDLREQPFPFRIVSKENGLGTATHSGVWTAHCTRQEMYNVFHAQRLIQDVVHHNQSAPTIDGHFEPKAVFLARDFRQRAIIDFHFDRLLRQLEGAPW